VGLPVPVLCLEHLPPAAAPPALAPLSLLTAIGDQRTTARRNPRSPTMTRAVMSLYMDPLYMEAPVLQDLVLAAPSLRLGMILPPSPLPRPPRTTAICIIASATMCLHHTVEI